MGVEALYLQEPLIGIAVEIEEFEAAIEAFDTWEIGFVLDEFAVDHVGEPPFAASQVELLFVVHLAETFKRRLNHGLPLVGLLAANEFPRRIALMVGPTAVLEVVAVVTYQV